jgi:hypothetical protein
MKYLAGIISGITAKSGFARDVSGHSLGFRAGGTRCQAERALGRALRPGLKRFSHVADVLLQFLGRIHTFGANQQVLFNVLNLIRIRGTEQKCFQGFFVNVIVNH